MNALINERTNEILKEWMKEKKAVTIEEWVRRNENEFENVKWLCKKADGEIKMKWFYFDFDSYNVFLIFDSSPLPYERGEQRTVRWWWFLGMLLGSERHHKITKTVSAKSDGRFAFGCLNIQRGRMGRGGRMNSWTSLIGKRRLLAKGGEEKKREGFGRWVSALTYIFHWVKTGVHTHISLDFQLNR